MKDTQDTNLPEEMGKLEDTKMPAEAPEMTATEETAEVASIAAGKITKEEILNKLAELVNNAAEIARADVETLKQAYYKIRRNEVEEEKAAFLENGGEEKDFIKRSGLLYWRKKSVSRMRTIRSSCS